MKNNIKDILNSLKQTKLFKYAFALYTSAKANDSSSSGATLTYYTLLSIFPFIIFLLSMLRFTPLADQNLLEIIREAIPVEFGGIIDYILNQLFTLHSDSITFISIGVMIYSASKVFKSLMHAINRAYQIENSRLFIYKYVMAFILTIFAAITLIITLLFVVFGDVILNQLLTFFHIENFFVYIFSIVRILFPLLMMYFTFTIMYMFATNKKIAFKYSIPGALFATFASIFGSLLFAFYINNIARYNLTYGSLGGIVVFLIWINFISNIVILGAEMNGVYLRSGQ